MMIGSNPAVDVVKQENVIVVDYNVVFYIHIHIIYKNSEISDYTYF